MASRKLTPGASFARARTEGGQEPDTLAAVVSRVPRGTVGSAIDEAPTPDAHGDNLTDHLTGNLTNNLTGKKDDKPASQLDGQITSNMTGKQESKLPDRKVSQPVSRSAKEIIQDVRHRNFLDPPVMKTVSLKLSMDDDDRIERLCAAGKFLKQDLIAAAIELFFKAARDEEEDKP